MVTRLKSIKMYYSEHSGNNTTRATRLPVILATAILGSGLMASLFAPMLIPAFANPCPAQGCVLDGRMTGGGKLEVTHETHGFELYCDINDGPNNLEINWDGGNNFHLESLTSIKCLDDPTIAPKPPNAGFDTYEAFGLGKLNQISGYEIYFELRDAGEPGKNDSMFFVIRAPVTNEIVHIANAHLDQGNHQAHK